jgi:replicative superfamily II helicase
VVDFKKRLEGKTIEKPADPLKLYPTLDRAHDKGPLRPAQEAVLDKWYNQFQNERDIVVKLHTGQGKTLVGLLMLQSRLNAGSGPVVYLCPNNFLIEQTEEQARQFGIKTCSAESELPGSFLDSSAILVTSVQKLFNGLTKFGLGRNSTAIDTVLMDDAHACSDIIRNQCRIRIPSNESPYSEIKALFDHELEAQGAGTYADLINGKRDAMLPIPYWAWLRKQGEIASLLSRESERKSIKFAWPLLKDSLAHCHAIISGAGMEIESPIAPLGLFGSYDKAKHRIFMSATVTDDAFLVKGLQLDPKTIRNPLTYSAETWSGEKMILLPSLIDDDLGRGTVIANYAPKGEKRRYGRVVLTPSFATSEDWVESGAALAEGDSFASKIHNLRRGEFSETVVLANRYDGIDLPDASCRILIFDSRPYSENLIDLYQENCRPGSVGTMMRLMRTIEQGMGRSVRGEKDYSVVLVVGDDIVRLLRDYHSRGFLSPQMRKQIEIGLEVTEFAKQDIQKGTSPLDVLRSLQRQCIQRDDDWKAYYLQEMEKVVPVGPNSDALEIYSVELQAEKDFVSGDYSGAAMRLQHLIDSGKLGQDEIGWYLQEQARYYFGADRSRSENLQIAAHKANRYLLKPDNGVQVAKLSLVSHGRAQRIKAWIGKFDNYADMNVSITEILGRLVFGTKADAFESGLDELSRALGFIGERPDKEWKEGPDNLWALDDKQYMLFECKSEVSVDRSDIAKRETEQMNRSSAWFEKHYAGFNVKRLIVHPANKIESAAAFTHKVQGVGQKELKQLVQSVQKFFKTFESRNLKDLSEPDIQSLINAHKLQVTDLISVYSRTLKDVK